MHHRRIEEIGKKIVVFMLYELMITTRLKNVIIETVKLQNFSSFNYNIK